ncbi:hypothetical protein OQA88_2669 [Cercophora sp. LCS_1]
MTTPRGRPYAALRTPLQNESGVQSNNGSTGPERNSTSPPYPWRLPLDSAHRENCSDRRSLESIQQLESGNSFNNRIYFVTVNSGEQYVLKVNGRFFGAEKIQNEVCCLNVLQRWCPYIPSPRVVAWSEDGLTVATHKEEPICIDDNTAPASPGWILMTRVPGDPVSSLTLSSQDMASIGMQLANLIATWRSDIPTMPYCGNLVFRSGAADIDLAIHSNYDRVSIRGLVDGDIRLADPISTSLQLQEVRLRAKLADLETNETYAPNRLVGPLVMKFMRETLPRLFRETTLSDPRFVFTSYDLAPRNVLITRLSDNEPPKITGIVDFEFAGFFPAVEEFVNDFVNNGGDWPGPIYTSYLDRLQELGVGTPRKGIEQSVWKREHLLGRLLDDIAPWWLPGPFDGDELADKLAECRGVVESTIRELEAMASSP